MDSRPLSIKHAGKSLQKTFGRWPKISLLELNHSLDLRYSKSNGILKLDMSKAYDRVCWKFLYSVMSRMVTPRRSAQGLRQGDPISTSLFIIVAKALSRDDIIIFTNSEEDGLRKLMQFLQRYVDISGQQINHAKSSFVPGKNANLIAHRIRNNTGFTMKSLPITYLGAPLYKGHKKKILYQTLIDKVDLKLQDGNTLICHMVADSSSSKVCLLQRLSTSFKSSIVNSPVGIIKKTGASLWKIILGINGYTQKNSLD
ncbi:UNVERIFIED_CONTAM: hypothetical protein Sradi_4892100 [Sesamum radiatum]|uniref:Reverse transcriptase domain-containing protein n=1 Tax=Sesamum radiatum TaxID=300843 RepID=A0AAW2MC24_SESRA